MTTLARPLERGAVRQADDEFYAKHPEFVGKGHPLQLSATDKAEADLRKEWVNSCVKHGGPTEDPSSEEKPPEDPVKLCRTRERSQSRHSK